MIRVAIIQFGEETNTFVPGQLELSDLIPNGWVEAQKVEGQFTATKTYIGGALDAIRDYGAVAVPMDIPAANGANFVAGAILSADCIKEAAEHICAELKRRRGEYDCIFFAMHGAAVSVADEDVESYMLRAVRNTVGDIKIMSSLDLHGNITEEMVKLSDGYIGLKTVPHTDCFDAGYQAANLLLRTMDGKVDPKMALYRLPLLISSAAGSTLEGAAKKVKEHFESYVKAHNLLDATFFHGFSSTDRACSCASVLVVADGYVPEKEARELAEFVWSQREGFSPPSLTAEKAVDEALTLIKDGYVVINECSDNPGSGCPGDTTFLLRELVKRNLPRSIMGQLVDPEAAAVCHSHQVGDRFTLSIGGKAVPELDEPLVTEVELLALSDGTFVSVSPVNAGVTMRFGPTARVRIGNVELTIVSERFQTFDDRPFIMTGCNMADYSLVGLKSMNHFRAYFAPIADGIVTADTPGLRPANIKNAFFKYVNRPIYPLDEDAKLL